MKRFLVIGMVLAFALAVGACKKGDEAATKKDKTAKTAKTEKKAEAKKAEPKKAEPKIDMSAWPDVCKKVAACTEAWYKAPESTHRDMVATEGSVGAALKELDEQIKGARERMETVGCPTMLKSMAGYDDSPAACK